MRILEELFPRLKGEPLPRIRGEEITPRLKQSSRRDSQELKKSSAERET